MTQLKFTPVQLGLWSVVRDEPGTVYPTGWAFADKVFLSGKWLARHILKALANPLPFSEILTSLNGNFAVISEFEHGQPSIDSARLRPCCGALTSFAGTCICIVNTRWESRWLTALSVSCSGSRRIEMLSLS